MLSYIARRLLLESAETQYEDALGNFLAAQHRAISQSAFMETLRKEPKKEQMLRLDGVGLLRRTLALDVFACA